MKNLCDYGCGQNSQFRFKNGKFCCSDNVNKCSAFMKKNSDLKKGNLNPAKRKEIRKKLSIAAKRRTNMFGESNPAKNIEVRLKLSGPNNPNWKGGIDCAPYCDVWSDKEFKRDIRIRDGHKCMNPVCKKISKNLSIHHIDYNKENCNPKNLITLCYSCNTSANFDREWHQYWYDTIIFRMNY